MAEKIVKGKIANALTSVAMNHIVATTEDIFDENLQKYQQDINEFVTSVIPSGTTNENQLVNKEYVDNEILHSSAYFRGTFETWDDVPENPEYILLKGKKRGTYMRLSRLDAGTDYEEYYKKITDFNKKVFNSSSPSSSFLTIGDSVFHITKANTGIFLPCIGCLTKTVHYFQGKLGACRISMTDTCHQLCHFVQTDISKRNGRISSE